MSGSYLFIELTFIYLISRSVFANAFIEFASGVVETACAWALGVVSSNPSQNIFVLFCIFPNFFLTKFFYGLWVKPAPNTFPW